MRISDMKPDHDELLDCALKLDVVSRFLSQPYHLTQSQIQTWRHFSFLFATTFSNVFNVEISTMLHSYIRHGRKHLLNHVCLRRGKAGENEAFHKDFEQVVNRTNSDIYKMAPQLFTALIEQFD